MSLLAAHGVSLRYGAATVLADAELTVAAGDAVAVAGPNGAGKSTLLRLLAGIEQPDSGEINATGTVGNAAAHRDRWAADGGMSGNGGRDGRRAAPSLFEPFRPRARSDGDGIPAREKRQSS